MAERSTLLFTFFCALAWIPGGRNEEFCDSAKNTDLNKVAKWANNLPALKRQDQSKLNLIENMPDMFMLNSQQIRHYFYMILSQPLQTVCSIPKKIGGEWIQSCAW